MEPFASPDVEVRETHRAPTGSPLDAIALAGEALDSSLRRCLFQSSICSAYVGVVSNGNEQIVRRLRP